MESTLVAGLQGLFLGVLSLSIGHVTMLAIACLLLYLGISKGYEPLLLVPIGFGAILVNIPLADMMGKEGFLRFFYDAGVLTEVFPLLIFIGIGAMTDFQPLLQNPKIILLGAAGQFGIFLTLLLALALGMERLDAVAVAIIGACDGPTAIYVSSKFAPNMLGAVSVAAYSYMSLVPLIQPPIMRALTTQKERQIVMGAAKLQPISRATKIAFPIIVTIFASILAPKGAPLIGTVMLGNLLRESGCVERLKSAAENEITNIATLLLGLCIGATMAGGLALAAVDGVPNFNVDPSCQAAAQQAAAADSITVCRNSEQRARDEIARQWRQLNAADKAQCVPAAAAGGNPTYTELLTCLEMARDIRQLHGQGQPTTTGQGVK